MILQEVADKMKPNAGCMENISYRNPMVSKREYFIL
jgi:hypothetical protein